MATLSERLSQIDEKISAAVVAVHADKRASQSLRDAVAEAWEISRKAIGSLKSADDRIAHEFAKEIEQAGQAARQAVESQPDVMERTRQAVLNAYLLIASLNKPN